MRLSTTQNHAARASFFLAAMLAFTLSGCGGKKVKTAKPPRIGSTETGIASWYGIPYHGRRAANGEIYDMEKLTAAHRTLPFGTWVRVKNLSNSKTIEVRIQDRGPFIDGRIIDLSKAAARSIDMIGPGITKVRLTVIHPPKNVELASRPPIPAVEPEVIAEAKPQPVPPMTRPTPMPAPAPPPVSPPPPVSAPPPAAAPIGTAASTVEAGPDQAVAPAVLARQRELFAVQVAALQDRTRAEALRLTMEQKYGAARIVSRQGRVTLWRVLVGEEDSMEKADALAGKVRGDGSQGFVVRLDPPVTVR